MRHMKSEAAWEVWKFHRSTQIGIWSQHGHNYNNLLTTGNSRDTVKVKLVKLLITLTMLISWRIIKMIPHFHVFKRPLRKRKISWIRIRRQCLLIETSVWQFSTYLNSSALAVEHSWFWYLSAPSMEREWAWVWPPEVTEAEDDICLEATRAALEALSLVGVVPLGGELRVGVILGGVDWGVLLPLIWNKISFSK